MQCSLKQGNFLCAGHGVCGTCNEAPEVRMCDSKVHGTSSAIVWNEIKFELAVCRGLSHHTGCVATCLSKCIIMYV